MAAPRTFGITELADGEAWLWLEEITDRFGGQWPLAHYGVAAAHLARFHGCYLTGRVLPEELWLNTDWARNHSDPAAAVQASAYLDAAWRHPAMSSYFPRTDKDRLRRMLDDQAGLIEALDRLPQVLCNHDAAGANLFARRRADGSDEIVAIDWEEIGPGAIGADIATLVFGTLRRFAVPVEHAADLDRHTFAGYLRGLRTTGWDGRPQLARFVYAAAVALRWTLAANVIRTLTDENARTAAETSTGLPFEQFARQRAALTRFLLDRANEARDLRQHV